jgi:hypothetical protein
MARNKLDAKIHCKAPFDASCRVHKDTNVTNTIEPRQNGEYASDQWEICKGVPSSYHFDRKEEYEKELHGDASDG